MDFDISKCGAVVLAAGRGSRLGCTDIPKVMLEIGGKPIVSYTVETLKALGFVAEQIVLVVGYQEEKVRDYFGDAVHFSRQVKLRGTADAAYSGIRKLPESVEHVLVLGGDDSAFYTAGSLQAFIASHVAQECKLSLLSTCVDDPSMLGRVIRHENGDVEIIEKEYVTPEQALVNEISTGTFVFDKQWYLDMFPTMPPLRKLGEYGLPTALAVAREQSEKYQVVELADSSEWFGVNTPEQLEEAQKRKQ